MKLYWTRYYIAIVFIMLLFVLPVSIVCRGDAIVKDINQKNAVQYRIEIDKSECLLNIYNSDNEIIRFFPIAVGKNRGDKEMAGDHRTPEGDFWVNRIRESSDWTHDFGDGKGEIKGAYGPWFFSLYTGSETTKSNKSWQGIGIHGTHDPSSIGSCASEGCIRLVNRDVVELKNYVCLGTQVKITD